MIVISTSTLLIGIAAVALISLVVYILVTRTVKCPNGKALVIYGVKNSPGGFRVLNGGMTFVWPIVQDYLVLDLNPINQKMEVKHAISSNQSRVSFSCELSVSIASDEKRLRNAAKMLSGLKQNEIERITKDIVFGQIRILISQLDDKTIKYESLKYMSQLEKECELELSKIGIRVISIHLLDVQINSTA